MKKWSKVICLILALAVFAAFSVASSSSDTEKKEIVSADQSAETSTANEDAAGETEEEAVTEEASSTDTTIEPQVIFDAEGVVITAQEYVTDGFLGDGLKVLIENNSDQDVGVGCDALIVNNYMITDLFGTEVAAGKKSNETIHLMSSELKAAGIENVGQIEIELHLYDPTTYETTYHADMATIQTSKFAEMDTTPNDDGQELFNSDGIRIVGKYVSEDTIWGTGILLYLENQTDQNVIVQCDDLSINGFMMQPYFSSTVYSGKMAIDEITVLSTELEENGVESVDQVELKFVVINPDTFDTITTTDVISFAAK